jgi:hypothetical protein
MISREFEDDGRRVEEDDLLPTSAFPDHHSYASQPITGEIRADDRVRRTETPRYVERFKGSPVYERAQAEATNLGKRLVDELAGAFRTRVVPVLIGTLRDLIAGGEPKESNRATSKPASATDDVEPARRVPQSANPGAGKSGYDDRYERESIQFGRGETPSRGLDLKFEAGRKVEE